MTKDQKITLKYILFGSITVITTWLVHEFSHWLTSETLGYETLMYLNGTSLIKGQNPSAFHANVISAAGPVVTIIQAVIAYLLLQSKGWNKFIYLILFTAFYMRFLAGLMNFINLNDEGRISDYFGIGTFTLPIFVSGILFFMVYKISKANHLNWKYNLSTTLIIMLFSSILILLDQFYGIKII